MNRAICIALSHRGDGVLVPIPLFQGKRYRLSVPHSQFCILQANLAVSERLARTAQPLAPIREEPPLCPVRPVARGGEGAAPPLSVAGQPRRHRPQIVSPL